MEVINLFLTTTAMSDTIQSSPIPTSNHLIFDLFVPALTKLVELETALYRELERRQLQDLQPPTAEDVKPLRAALEEVAEQLKPMMQSVLGESPSAKTNADLEALPSPAVLLACLPAEFLWLALTKYLQRCRDVLIKTENPIPEGLSSILGLPGSGGISALLSALKAGGADISLKVVDAASIEKLGMTRALEEATDLLAGEDREDDADENPEDFPKED